MIKLPSLRPKRTTPLDSISVGYRQKPSMNKVTFVAVFGVLLAAASFYEGTAYQRTADNNGAASSYMSVSLNAQNRNSTSGNSLQSNFSRLHVVGQVSFVSSAKITVQDQRSGQNTTLAINDNTEVVLNGQDASASDIQDGDLAFITKANNSSDVAARIIANSSTSQSLTDGSGSSTSGLSATIPSLQSN